MNKFRRPLSQRGDTIVEVLICIAILGFVLSGAYTLSMRNQATSQKSQERSIASGKAESQLEKLRTFMNVNENTDGITENNFCFVGDLTPVGLSGSAAPSADINADSATTYTGCTDGIYRMAIWKPVVARNLGGVNDTNSPYAVTVRWERVGGGGWEEISMYYTIFPGRNP